MIGQQLKFSSVMALLLSQVIDGKKKEMDTVLYRIDASESAEQIGTWKLAYTPVSRQGFLEPDGSTKDNFGFHYTRRTGHDLPLWLL